MVAIKKAKAAKPARTAARKVAPKSATKAASEIVEVESASIATEATTASVDINYAPISKAIEPAELMSDDDAVMIASIQAAVIVNLTKQGWLISDPNTTPWPRNVSEAQLMVSACQAYIKANGGASDAPADGAVADRWKRLLDRSVSTLLGGTRYEAKTIALEARQLELANLNAIAVERAGWMKEP